MANRYVVDTTLTGFINCFEPSGKYNNMCFSFNLPESIIEEADKDRVELLKWVASKVENPKRMATNPPKWTIQDSLNTLLVEIQGALHRSLLIRQEHLLRNQHLKMSDKEPKLGS